MKKVCILILTMVIGLLYVAALAQTAGSGELNPLPKYKCPVCGMFVAMFADWNSRVELKDSTVAFFDGAKCMFKYYLGLKKYDSSKNKEDITAIVVKDYYSKTSIDALRAYFVVWSDLYGPMGHEPIAFEKEADAKKFMKEHKGKKILRFKDINPKLIWSLDNP